LLLLLGERYTFFRWPIAWRSRDERRPPPSRRGDVANWVLEPENGEHHYNLGAAYFKKRDYSSAIKNYDKALRLGFEGEALTYDSRGKAKQRLGDRRAGQADMEKARKIDPNVGK
jgi:tetratricopeptide (TPR) repeat protein